MNRREAERLTRQADTLRALGFTAEEAESLRRISMTLRRWHERECGDGNGCIEREEQTGRAAPSLLTSPQTRAHYLAMHPRTAYDLKRRAAASLTATAALMLPVSVSWHVAGAESYVSAQRALELARNPVTRETFSAARLSEMVVGCMREGWLTWVDPHTGATMGAKCDVVMVGK